MKLKLVKKLVEAKDTMTFFWETQKDFSYLPGQYMYITLNKLTIPDSKGATRHFTISSSPTEGKVFSFTTKIRDKSGFKQTLKDIEIGYMAEFSGPEGTFIFDESEAGHNFFVAGGIGITPFRSALKYQFDKQFKTKSILLVSNSKLEDVSFKKDLDTWSEDKNISIFHTLSQETTLSKGINFLGRVNSQMLQDCADASFLSKATFWVCGPPAMVRATTAIIEALPFNTKIYTESFTGY